MAVLELLKCTGANAATETVATDNLVRVLSQDSTSTTVGFAPIALPIAPTAFTYSMELVLRWKIATGGAPANKIENIKTYGPASQPATGVILYIGTTATGATPVGGATVSTIAVDRIDSGANPHNSSATALAVGTPQALDQLVSVGDKTDFIYVQASVDSTAAIADGEFTLWLEFDES